MLRSRCHEIVHERLPVCPLDSHLEKTIFESHLQVFSQLQHDGINANELVKLSRGEAVPVLERDDSWQPCIDVPDQESIAIAQ